MRYGDSIHRQVAVFKALAHETRLRLVEILAREGEKCVCELVDRVGFDQSTISKHLSVLKAAGVVGSRKERLNVIYRLRTPCVYQFIKCVDQMNGDKECVLACPGAQQGGEAGDVSISGPLPDGQGRAHLVGDESVPANKQGKSCCKG